MSNGMSESERYQRYLAGREWGLRREAVRKRCGGICERCRHNPMSHVHHLTYARKYYELLEDLQALCEPCHEFTHGKRDRDPKLDVPVKVCGRIIRSIYLAGKITGADWRDEIVRHPSVVRFPPFYEADEFGREWPVVDDGILLPDGRSLAYSGPYRVSGKPHEQGCARHAFGPTDDTAYLDNDETCLYVPDLCRNAIDRSDLVFAWIDSLDCYGTLLEIGYADAKDKLILIASPHFHRDLWFAYALADLISPDAANLPSVFFSMILGNHGETMVGFRNDFRFTCHGEDPIDGWGGFEMPEDEVEGSSEEDSSISSQSSDIEPAP